jgi:hypothetical protein
MSLRMQQQCLVTLDTELMGSLGYSLKAFSTQQYEQFLDQLVRRALTNDSVGGIESLVAACQTMVKLNPVAKPKAVRKPRKPKNDPNAPKRPLTSFMFFCKANRLTIKKEHPGLSFGELGSAVAAKWAKLSNAEKEPYTESSAKDKERYEKQMEIYRAT